MKLIFLVGALFSLCACSNKDLPDYFKLNKLRILAIQADPSEVNPESGSSPVSITPFVTDLDGAGRSLTYTLEACTDPGVNLGATPSCDHDSHKTTQTGTFTLASPRFTQAVSALTVTVPSNLLSGRSATDKHNGVAYLVLYRVEAANGDKALSFKRIIGTTRTPLNGLPGISAITREGVTISALPAVDAALAPSLSNTGESYTVLLEGGTTQTKTETTTLSWFVSDGKMKFSRTADTSSNAWIPPHSTTLPLFLVAIVRDDRGGVAFTTVGP